MNPMIQAQELARRFNPISGVEIVRVRAGKRLECARPGRSQVERAAGVGAFRACPVALRCCARGRAHSGGSDPGSPVGPASISEFGFNEDAAVWRSYEPKRELQRLLGSRSPLPEDILDDLDWQAAERECRAVRAVGFVHA